jgi:hypothetical protein
VAGPGGGLFPGAVVGQGARRPQPGCSSETVDPEDSCLGRPPFPPLRDMADGKIWSDSRHARRKVARGRGGSAEGLARPPRRSSLARLLAEHRGTRNRKALPKLTVQDILSWADAYFRRTGSWPTRKAGLIRGPAGDTWLDVDEALRVGTRGLAGGSSLPRLLAAYRSVRNRKALPRLRSKEILAWADAHFERTGKWPTADSGSIPGTSGETWLAVESALRKGIRGGGSSLHRLLVRYRRKR